MKYVMLQVQMNQMCNLLPVIFPAQLVHVDVATGMRAVCGMHWPRAEVSFVSAGTIILDNVEVGGHSTTMGLRSHPDDASIIYSIDVMRGLVAAPRSPLRMETPQNPQTKRVRRS